MKMITEPEIADFGYPVFHKDVGCFEIPVSDSSLGDSLQSFCYSSEYFSDLHSGKVPGLRPFLQLTPLAMLHHKIVVITGLQNFLSLDDIDMADFSSRLHLVFKQQFFDIREFSRDGDDFDGNGGAS